MDGQIDSVGYVHGRLLAGFVGQRTDGLRHVGLNGQMEDDG